MYQWPEPPSIDVHVGITTTDFKPLFPTQIGNFPGNQGVVTQGQSEKQLNWVTK